MTIVATAGSSSANSYVTLIEAESYFEERYDSDDWSDLTDTVKEQLLITSSRILDWYLPWKGFKATSTQSMDWPRVNAILPGGTTVDSTIIPTAIKIAVYELALSSFDKDRTADSSMAGIESISLGTLSITADDGDSDSTEIKTIPEKIRRMLSDYYTYGSLNVIRLIRA